MNTQRILAFSSSRTGSSAYLEKTARVIKNFLGEEGMNIAFIPFASVDKNYEEYTKKVREGLAVLSHNIRTAEAHNAKEVIEESNVVMVGGGNSFKLLHDLYVLELVELIKQKVHNGTPYIGWSAGTNLTGLTIGTTNDMPIIEPQSFKALGFFPFQINPHYYNVVAEGFNGETRDQRLEEFLKLNPAIPVVCLPEGTALKFENTVLVFVGERPGILMSQENEKLVRKEIMPGTNLSFLF